MKSTPPVTDPGNNKTKGSLPNFVKIILVLLAILIGYGAVFFGTARAESLTAACYKDYRPYSYIDAKGEIVGVLIDFWRLWAEKNHVDLTFVPGHLTQSLERVNKGEADFMIGLFKSKERSELFDFSTDLLDIQTNLYVRQEKDIETIIQMGDTPIGVIEDDYVVAFLAKNHPNLKVKTFSGSEAVVKSALAGKIDAYALDFPNAIFLLAEHDSLTKFRILQSLYTEKLRAGVAKGNGPLLAMLNKGIKAITKEDINELSNKWGINPPPLIVQYRWWIIAAIVVLLGGCVGFVFYIIRLKSRMRQMPSGNRPFDQDEWMALIAHGENDWVEFKSSLRYNLKTEKSDKVIEAVIIKTLSAFMNARGGTLFIGVNDDGDLVGIESDYKTFQKKPNRDGFILKLTSMISTMGRQSHKFIVTDIQTMEGKDICRITVKPGEKPVFLKANGKESFYIRAGASSVPLGMSEAHEYISSRW